MPFVIAKRNGLDVVRVDQDEPAVASASGHNMEIMGQTTFMVKFTNLRKPKKMRVLVCREAGDEILVDLRSLVAWSILPKNFPEPMDPREQEIKSRAKATKYKREIIQRSKELEDENEMESIKESLMKEFSDVFKKQLTPED